MSDHHDMPGDTSLCHDVKEIVAVAFMTIQVVQHETDLCVSGVQALQCSYMIDNDKKRLYT